MHLHVCLCMCAVGKAALFICLTCTSLCSRLSISVPGCLYSRSNCHRSDCSSLDAMEAVIGHPRHSDQCRCYYRDFRHRGPRQPAQPRPKGNWVEGEEVMLRGLLWLHRDWTTTRQGVYWQLTIQHASALSIQLIDTLHRMCLSASSHFSPCLINGTRISCCHTSPVNGCFCVQSTV